MKNTTLFLSVFGILAACSVQAQMKGDTYHLPAIEVMVEKTAAISDQNTLLKYAMATAVDDIYFDKNDSQSGHWTQMFDGSWQYNLRLAAKNATSLNAGLKNLFLPPSAEMWVSTDDKQIMRGPYDGSYNQKHGFFWTGDVPADHMNIRITVNDRDKQFLSFKLNNVSRGFYRHWIEPNYLNKSGSCNVDVACSEGDDWQSQISAVGRYTFSTSDGGFLCTGQLINNTAQDGTPLFLTADHCGYSENGVQKQLSVRQNVAASMALTWNYQSTSCRAPGSGQSGVQISTSGFNQRQSGATYLASNPGSDFSLVRLNSVPDSSYGLEYTGWDRRDVAPERAVSIHHPSGHAKRISFENDPLTITGRFSNFSGNRGYLRVSDWDVGTTEGGSSGGGLWNQEKLLIGQLFGGSAACGNDDPDWYGRLFTSWDNGNDAQSRMKDWLDPNNTGQETLQGSGGCEAPNVTIVNNSSNSVGDLLTYASNVTGGNGGYSYSWDINGDQGVDGTDADIEARYNHEFVGNINLTVTDSAGCVGTASKAVVIISADVQLQQIVNIRENLDQVCGNNDDVVDPGERWSTLLNPVNQGAKTATDSYLALAVSRSSVNGGESDDYGNTSNECDRQFIDISSTNNLIPWESAGTQYPADDEGSALIQLAQSFDHYGQSIDQIRASTNGYFSTSTASDGSDWTHDCPLPVVANRDAVGARIAPLHVDMNSADFYHQSFSICPRPAETGTDLACEVFLWQGADLWSTEAIEGLDVQAILYPETSQWVYQYSGEGIDGTESTTGMQNATASDGLNYACNTANSINTSQAVCTFNKNNQPGSGAADFVKLLTPVISLADLNVNDSKFVDLEFTVSEDALCGSNFSIDHEASVYDEGFNPGQNNILSKEIGQNGQCNVVNNCGVGDATQSNNNIKPRRGLWWNPDRNGNGLDLYQFNQDSLLYYFYTADKNGDPVWYLANDAESANNQYFNNIARYSVPGGYGNGPVGFDVIGWSNTSFIDDSTAIQVRQISGNLSAEKQMFFQYAPNETANMHTGPFFTPSESGWGQSIGTLGNARVALTYLYDLSGNPYWTIGNGANDNTAFAVSHANTFCPSCPAVDAQYNVVGDIKLTLNGQVDGILNRYNISHDNVSWSRTNLPLQIIIPPEN